MGKRLTEEQLKAVAADYEAGMIRREIAEKHGCCETIIERAAKKYGVGLRKPRLPEIVIGRKFGRLTVISAAASEKRGIFWQCLCDCGAEHITTNSNLFRGSVKSCGCLRLETLRESASKPQIDLTGQKFGRLTVVAFHRNASKGSAQWLCRCDCGKEKVATSLNLRNGWVKSCGGRPCRYPNWQGKQKTSGGYVKVLAREHANADKKGYVLEHRFVMSKVLGRALKDTETVHHINGIRNDNRPENLELWQGNHGKGQRVNDKIADAYKYLQEYAPHLLADPTDAI